MTKGRGPAILVGMRSGRMLARAALMAAVAAGGLGARAQEAEEGAAQQEAPALRLDADVLRGVDQGQTRAKAADRALSNRLVADARAALGRGDVQAAVDAATNALDTDKTNPAAWLVRSMANVTRRAFEDALQDAEGGLKAAPGDTHLLSAKSQALNRLRRYELALVAADDAVRASSSNAAGYANRAFAQGMMGDAPGMLESLRRAVAADPSFEPLLKAAEAGGGADVFLLPEERAAARERAEARPAGGGMRLGLVLGGAAAAAAALVWLIRRRSS